MFKSVAARWSLFKAPAPPSSVKIQKSIDPLLNVGGDDAKFAVVRMKSTKYKVQPGDVIWGHAVKAKIGERVSLKKVEMVGGQRFTAIGRPLLENATVLATVEEHKRSASVPYLKWTKRINHNMFRDNRDVVTALRISRIIYEPNVVGELDKYSGDLVNYGDNGVGSGEAREFDIDTPVNPVYSTRGDPSLDANP